MYIPQASTTTSNKFKTTLIWLCSFLLPFALVAPTSAAQANSLLIGPGDQLHVSVLNMPEMDQQARVTDAGDVPVQGIGAVHVAGMTPGQAATVIHDRYISEHFLNHPEVSVSVLEYATQNVTLIGQVRTPGAYPLPTARPILDVIALAGGLDDIANRNILIERHGQKSETVHYKVSNDPSEAVSDQVMVFPGDTVVVPKAGIIYILGDVNRPGGYTMTDNQADMSLLEALSMAGGPAKTAKLGHARLIRKEDHSDTELSLGDIETGKKADIALSPGDILFVPFSYAKNLVIAGSGGLLGSASTAAVYAGK
jgi:polysaccharide export outer membrane protein